ncbi:MAG: hypothetical protein DLM63_12740 [Solirubrobacterales bacterium]|nr:MAG: hypothetical protein DLM63_12740 [Solirubrobacterales bacterium]
MSAQPFSPPGETGERGRNGTSTVSLRVALGVGVLVSIALGFALRELGRGVFDVPRNLPSLALSALLPATVFPVLGNGFGFFMSFRAKPHRHSMQLFLAIGAVMTAVGIAISATKLPSGASVGSLATTLSVSIIPVLLIVPALLLLVPRSATVQDAVPRTSNDAREQSRA